MEATAKVRHLRVTPMKSRRVVDLVRGKRATEAVQVLRFSPQTAAAPVRKLVESAIANARVEAEKYGERFVPDELVVTTAFVDEGPTLKRFQPRAQGRAFSIRKRTSHITVVVASPEADSARDTVAAGGSRSTKGAR